MTALPALEAIERYAVLGPDFLTWLCVRVLGGDTPKPRDVGEIELAVKGPVVLEGEAGEATRVSLTGEFAAESAELRSALREGKKLMRTRLVLTMGIDQFEFTMQAATFDLSSVKLPVPATGDREQFLIDRVAALQRLYEVLDALFEEFLAIRLAPPAWKKEAARWVKLATPK